MIVSNNPMLTVVNLGKTDYRATWKLQKQLVKLRYENKVGDLLLLTEHPPVITMGRGTDRTNLLASADELDRRGVGLFEIERGGDITFHGPGQAIMYPIVDLRDRDRDVRQYLRDLEEAVILALENLGLEADVKEGLTGIWVDDCKVGAIGVAVSQWITYHGMALNVNTDMDYFDLINPCGITEYPVGSVSQLLGEDVSLAKVQLELVSGFADVFTYEEYEKVDDIETLISASTSSTE